MNFNDKQSNLFIDLGLDLDRCLITAARTRSWSGPGVRLGVSIISIVNSRVYSRSRVPLSYKPAGCSVIV